MSVALLKWHAQQRADPLSHFSFSYQGKENTPQRLLVEHTLAGHETALSGSNQCGKTTGGAALLVALAQGRPSLGGIKLPPPRPKGVWWVLTQTWKQQVESTQAAVLQWLGDWPHVVRPVSGIADAIQQIRVAPWARPSAPKSEWARIWFHVQATGETLPGGRVDGVWPDEPPDIHCWEEATARGRRNQTLYLWLTYTPIKRAQWEPLKLRFEGALGQLCRGRIRLQAKLEDNPWLSAEHISKLKERWRGQWDFDARAYGAEVDETGQCPFTSTAEGKLAMSRWQHRVRPGKRIGFRVLSERGEDKLPLELEIEQWWPFEPQETYYGVIDPSLGIASPEHDPCEFHVYARMRPRLVVHFGGYLEPYALGWLAGEVMQQYGKDLLDIEMNDNLGIQVMRGARDAGFNNFAGDFREDKVTGQVENLLGWKTTQTNRGGMIAAVQQMLLEDSVEICSHAVLDGLRGIVVNPKGRIEAGLRKHDEAMICLGRFGYVSRGMGSPSARTQRMAPAREQLHKLLGVLPTPKTPDPELEWWRGE